MRAASTTTRAWRIGAAAAAAAGALAFGLWLSARADIAAKPVAVIDALYPEGPVVIDGSLFVAEMTADRIVRFTRAPTTAAAGIGAPPAAPELTRDVFWEEAGCGPTALAALDAERLVALCHLGGYLAVLDRSGAAISRIAHADDGARLGSPNDVSADGTGAAYFSNAGLFSPRAEPTGVVYRLGPDLTVAPVTDGFFYANGVAVLDDALLISEHLGKRLWRQQIADGAASGDRTILQSSVALGLKTRPGEDAVGPDGVEPDGAGAYYVALYGDGRVARFGAEGTRRDLLTPQQYVTNVAVWDDLLVVVGAYQNDRPPYDGAIALYRLADIEAD